MEIKDSTLKISWNSGQEFPYSLVLHYILGNKIPRGCPGHTFFLVMEQQPICFSCLEMLLVINAPAPTLTTNCLGSFLGSLFIHLLASALI